MVKRVVPEGSNTRMTDLNCKALVLIFCERDFVNNASKQANQGDYLLC